MKVLRRGFFNVNQYEYRNNPDQTAALAAKKFISQIIRESISKITIEKVLYENIDITEKVKVL